MKRLEDYLKYEQPTKYIVDSDEYSDEYDIPVLTAGKSFILGYTNETNNIFPKDKLPVIIFDDFTTDCKYVDFPFKVKSSAMKILHPINNANAKFLYYFMTKIKFDNTLHKRYWISEYSQLPIKELNDDEQNEFVEKMQKLEVLINTRNKQIENCNKLIKSQFVEMFNDNTFEVIELNELCDVRDGTHDSPKYLDSSKYKFITSKNIVGDSIDFSDCKYIKEDDFNKFNQRSKVNTGDILMPMIGTIGNPIIVNIPEDEIDFAIKNVVLIKFNNSSKVTNVYIKSLLNSDFFENAISQNKRGGTQKFIALSDIRKIKVPVPPIELQNKFAQIVEQIDKQKFEFENSLKKLEELQASLMQEYFG